MPRQNNDPRKPSQIETLLSANRRGRRRVYAAHPATMLTAGRNLRCPQRDQMAALEGIAANLRTVPASHVSL